jgi:hypothetical protein
LNRNGLPEERKESIIVPIDKKADETDCSNYRGISPLSAIYQMLSYILVSTPNAEKINGDRQSGFECNRSTADHVFCICQILQKKREYNQVVPQLFIDFKKTCM